MWCIFSALQLNFMLLGGCGISGLILLLLLMLLLEDRLLFSLSVISWNLLGVVTVV